VLLARDPRLSRPGCTVAGANCQVHHAVNDWADDGHTNVDDLTLACPTDNRMVKPGGWTTRKRKDGRTEWIPPPHLDSGQSRVNNYHHPENYLLPRRRRRTHRGLIDPQSQHATSTNTVMAVTVVTMSSIAPGTPESIRENV